MNHTIVSGDLNAVKSRNVAVYCDDRIAFLKELPDIESGHFVKLEEYTVLLCLKGHVSFSIDDRTYSLGPNDLLICHPGHILGKNSTSEDFDVRSICLSKAYTQSMVGIGPRNAWKLILFLEQTPILHLDPDDVHTFCLYYDLILSRITKRLRNYQKELLDNLLRAFLYEFREVLERFVQTQNSNGKSIDKVFLTFIELLASTYPKPRSVAFYADRLCITGKYLSSVCKNACGRTATELINHYVVNDIKVLLRQSDKSIKEIACELQFPNLSFFGHYVKKFLGRSPREYRAALR